MSNRTRTLLVYVLCNFFAATACSWLMLRQRRPLIVAVAVILAPALFWFADKLQRQGGTNPRTYLSLVGPCLACAWLADAWTGARFLSVFASTTCFAGFSFHWLYFADREW